MATHEATAATQAAEALWLLSLIERHGLYVSPVLPPDHRKWLVESTNSACEHFAPTLIEALTEASNCNRCCGRES